MAVILASTKGMPREEWLKLRKQGIGGSDAAAIAGFNPYKAALAVYLEKIGEIEDRPAGESAEWGTLLEPIVADQFSKRTGLKIRRQNAVLVHPEYPFIIGNIDYRVTEKGKRGVLEVKTTSAFKAKEWDGDKVPDLYAIQLQHYLAITGDDFGYFAVLIGGQQLIWKRVERDDRLIAALIAMEVDFWQNHVEKRVPPPFDGTEASTNLLDQLYPESKPEKVIEELPPQSFDLVRQYEEAKAEEKAAKARKEAAANQLKGLMGDAETAWVGATKIRWASYAQERIDTKALKAQRPDVAAQFIKTIPVRKFEVTPA